jgi:hypothetical protein
MRLTGREAITVFEYTRVRAGRPWLSQDTIRRRMGGWAKARETVLANRRRLAEERSRAHAQHAAHKRRRTAKTTGKWALRGTVPAP